MTIIRTTVATDTKSPYMRWTSSPPGHPEAAYPVMTLCTNSDDLDGLALFLANNVPNTTQGRAVKVVCHGVEGSEIARLRADHPHGADNIIKCFGVKPDARAVTSDWGFSLCHVCDGALWWEAQAQRMIGLGVEVVQVFHVGEPSPRAYITTRN